MRNNQSCLASEVRSKTSTFALKFLARRWLSSRSVWHGRRIPDGDAYLLMWLLMGRRHLRRVLFFLGRLEALGQRKKGNLVFAGGG